MTSKISIVILSIIFWCLFLRRLVHASHFVTKPLNGAQLLEEDSQSIDARSPTECILKCRNQFQKDGFYTDDNSCYCTNGTTWETTNESGLNGNLFSKRIAESFKSRFVFLKCR